MCACCSVSPDFSFPTDAELRPAAGLLAVPSPVASMSFGLLILTGFVVQCGHCQLESRSWASLGSCLLLPDALSCSFAPKFVARFGMMRSRARDFALQAVAEHHIQGYK